MFNKVYRVLFVTLLCLGGVLTACEKAEEPTPTPEPDQIVVQLNWVHEAEFAGYYVAHDKGFYADENIAVTFREHDIDGSTSPGEWLVDGTADVAVLVPFQYEAVAGSEAQPIVVMAVYQLNSIVLFAKESSGIQTPRDLIGHRVAVKNDDWRGLIHSTLENAGVDPAQIVEVEVDFDAIDMFYTDQVDVWAGIIGNEVVEARLAGYDVNMILLGDYGVGGAYDGLVTLRQEMLDDDPNLVARFVRATQRGWRYAVEHIDEAAEITFEWQPDKSVDFHRLALESFVPLISVGQTPIGWIDAARWQTVMGDAYDSGRPGYTMQFLQAEQ